MYSLRRLAVLVIVGSIVAGCATMQIRSYVATNADLARFHTYAWASDDSFATGDARLDNNPFFQRRVQAAAEQQLGARGFEKTRAVPDLLLHCHASITQRLDLADIDRTYVSAGEFQPSVYDAGTLLIDVVDTRTNRLLWRGWAEGSLDGAVGDQHVMEQTIDNAITRIFAKFPPRASNLGADDRPRK